MSFICSEESFESFLSEFVNLFLREDFYKNLTDAVDLEFSEVVEVLAVYGYP